LNKVTVFLPMRKGSQRIKNKNIKDFSRIKGGLSFIKISQLLKVESISRIVISTDDDEVKILAKSFNNDKIIIDERPEKLATSETSTDDLIEYIPTIIKSGIVLWTHVTSPFVDEFMYQNMIQSYFNNLGSHDSLMSVTKIQKFIWSDGEPLNYDKSKEKWPRTQTLAPIFEINSGVFLADIGIYKEFKDRIGSNPYLYKLDGKEAFDIDWEDDFEIAEILWSKYGGL
jgi:CMP-N-acetylneuraminic acid synthetase